MAILKRFAANVQKSVARKCPSLQGGMVVWLLLMSVIVGPDSSFARALHIEVTDGELSDSAVFALTVNPVNDAPTLDDLANASVDEDEAYTLELSGADVDNDPLTFLASVEENGSASIDGSTLTVTPAADFNGDLTVNIIASDGQASGSGSFTLTVNPVNDSPVIDDIADQSIDEDSSLTIELSGSDVDGDNLIFTIDDQLTDFGIAIEGTTLTIVPPANYFGSQGVTVKVSDGDLFDFAD